MFGNLNALLRRKFGADREYYTLFYDMLGFTPYNIDLYKLALIHRSASIRVETDEQMGESNEGEEMPINNERLEYLGDAIIEAVTSDYLFIEYPLCDEGFLTKMRSKIVSRSSLNSIAKSLGLNTLLITSQSVKIGEEVIDDSKNNAAQKNLLGDALEALVGAIYLDMGYDFVNRLLINKIYQEHLDLQELQCVETDFKSRLIEWAQKEHHKIEFITSNNTGGRGKSPIFTSVIHIGGIEVGHGSGSSKKEAEQNASYSVSQGGMNITDNNTDRLLSEIDKIEESESVNL